MLSNLRAEACNELNYTAPCTLPDNKELFDPFTRSVVMNRANKARRLAICVDCSVRVQCLTDAVNEVLDSGTVDDSLVVGFQAGKTPLQQAAMAREFKLDGLEQVTMEQVANNWRSQLPM